MVETIWHGSAILGEGPIWDAQRGVLWFTDIKAPRIHCFDPGCGRVRDWDAPERVGWAIPAEGGVLIAGLKSGLFRFDPVDGSFTSLIAVEGDLPDNRLNDATVDRQGRIWFGTMDDRETETTGHILRWDGRDLITLDLDPVIVSNGPALSPDGRTLYHVDTVGGIIHASRIDGSGGVGDTQVFVRIDTEDGYPDGVSTDVRGNLWVGLWGGGAARCYRPNGTLLQEVRLPTSNVTKVALGGKDFATAYVTTASIGLSDAERIAQPDAGHLFSFRVDVPGIPLPLARG